MINFKMLLIIFLLLILVDKGLTITNILLVNKNFPEATKNDYYIIEKNPVAKWFFQKFGLWNGSVLYSIVSLLTLFITFFLLQLLFSERITLYIIVMLYGLVIFNNLFFTLRYGGFIL